LKASIEIVSKSKTFSFLECGKVATVVKDRIQIVDNEDDETDENLGENQLVVSLQTTEGRKSRIKFLIFKVLLQLKYELKLIKICKIMFIFYQ
jgi:hypothetical protein